MTSLTAKSTHHIWRFFLTCRAHFLLQSTTKMKPTLQVRTQADRARTKEQERKKTNKLIGNASTKSSEVKNEMKKMKE
jgi:hypothetical protein